MLKTCTVISNFYRPQTCSWWHQAGRSTLFLQLVSWSLFLLSHLSCTAEEAHLVSQCTSELDHKQKKMMSLTWLDWLLLRFCTASYRQLKWQTSRHDVANILNGESRVFVLRVYPDHPVTKSAHGQYGPGWKWSSSYPWPVKTTEEEVKKSDRK